MSTDRLRGMGQLGQFGVGVVIVLHERAASPALVVF